MRRALCVVVFAVAVAVMGWSQQLLVFPAITDQLPGLHGSFWVTNIRLVAASTEDEPIEVRRAWAALEDGGFEDDPDTQVRWALNGSTGKGRVAIVTGGGLLVGTAGDSGAVGLVVEGGDVIAHAYIADVRYGDYDPYGAAFGQGQLVPAIREPLVGPSHIPWLGGCRNSPCSQDPPELWDFLRNNVGLVNPNPEPMSFEFIVIPFGFWWVGFPGYPTELTQDPPETFTKTVPPYGWLQFRWEATERYLDSLIPQYGFIVSLTPDSDLPYYAYVSVVFTPDPESGAPQFNSPMFVPAEPGFVAPLGVEPVAAREGGGVEK